MDPGSRRHDRAFNSETIASADIRDVGDLIWLLPNVTAKGQASNLGIRGVTHANIDGQLPVAQHVNGIYRPTSLAYSGLVPSPVQQRQ